LAQVALRRERFGAARAEFQQALAEAREIRDVAATLVALNGLGLVEKALGEKDAARKHWREAEALARVAGEKRLLATTLANQAALDLQIGDTRPAVVRLEEAIALDREIENLPGLAQDLALLGRAYEQQGDQPGAIQRYRQARTIARHTGQGAEFQRYDREIDRLERESGGPLQQGQLKSFAQEGRSE
jgi:tetratricopeptide (TPR) repeat protein